jgi:Fic family protein
VPFNSIIPLNKFQCRHANTPLLKNSHVLVQSASLYLHVDKIDILKKRVENVINIRHVLKHILKVKFMKVDKNKPFNQLPPLPPKKEIESKIILKKAASSHRYLAELKGIANTIPNQTILINSLTLREARSSSEIENVVTTNDKLFKAFSSSARSIDPQTKEVLRYRQALWTGYNRLKKRQVFSTNLFVDIFQIIKQTDEGIRTTPGTRVPNGRGVIVYTPPEGERVIRDKLERLEEFIHNDKDNIDPLVKLALIHYQFEAIHPFTDGNGRTGRIMNVLYLFYKKLLDLPILYLSQYIIRYKAEYYRLLRNVTFKEEWEPWINYSLETIEKTSIKTKEKIVQIRDQFSKTLDNARKRLPPNVYSKELIELLFEQPYCKIQFVVDKGIAKRQTAAEYLKELERIGILKKKKVGKENLFLNKKLFEILKN